LPLGGGVVLGWVVLWPVSLPGVVPGIELSLPLPPVEVDVPGAGVAGLAVDGCVAALPDVSGVVPDFAPLSEAQAPSSNPPAPSATQSQSLFFFMRVFLPSVPGSGTCERHARKRRERRLSGRGWLPSVDIAGLEEGPPICR
jgi:hypothetical protein